jgi:hypothetical protein
VAPQAAGPTNAAGEGIAEVVPDQPRPLSIFDGYRDLLGLLSHRRRMGLIASLSVGFYEGWRPHRAEVADLIAFEISVLTVDEAHDRVRQRRRGADVPDITAIILAAATTPGHRVAGQHIGNKSSVHPLGPGTAHQRLTRYPAVAGTTPGPLGMAVARGLPRDGPVHVLPSERRCRIGPKTAGRVRENRVRTV